MTATQTCTATAEIAFGELEPALKTVGYAINQRLPGPILSGVRVELDPSGITLAGFDFDVSVRVHLPATVTGTAVTGTVRALVNHYECTRVLSALGTGKAKRTREAMPVRMRLDEGCLALSVDDETMPLKSLPVEDYPQLPDVPAAVATVDREEFTDALTRVAVARGGTETAWPVLAGLNLTPSGSSALRLECTDRFRLARAHVPATGSPEHITALPPARRLVDLCKQLTASTGETLQLGVGENGANARADGPPQLAMVCGSVQITMRSFHGEGDDKFPQTDQLMPEQTTHSVTAPRGDLLQRAEKCGSLTKAKDERDQVKMTTTATGLSVAPVVSEEQHRVSVPETPAAVTDPGAAPVFLGAGFLRDAMKNFSSDMVTLHFQGNTRPLVVTEDPDGLDQPQSYRHLLMPIRP